MKPFIGITMGSIHGARVNLDYETNYLLVANDYIKAIVKAGGIPVSIPIVNSEDFIKLIVQKIDGVILSGGYDVSPWIYGEHPRKGLGRVNLERDIFEVKLVKEVVKRNIPLLGICRGCQVINVALGGTLIQDINEEINTKIPHTYRLSLRYEVHRIKIDPKSKLAKILGTTELIVNSSHHQAVKRVGKGLRAVAWADDGIIEAIESEGDNFVIGVQWHPERILNEVNLRLFREFVKTCSKYARE